MPSTLSGSFRRSRCSVSFFCKASFTKRHRNVQVTDFELGGIKSGITILRAQMPGERDIDILSADLGHKLAAGYVTIKIDLIILYFRLTRADGGVGRGGRRAGKA